ncbi:MAG: carboxylesterase/lipase family protein [Pseudomonadales bacterium]
MNAKTRWCRLLGVCLHLAVASACGGGGGNSGNPAPIAPVAVPLPADQIRVSEGIYRGEERAGLLVFKGIPYAQAPIADLRFKKPVPPPIFNGVQDAKIAGALCPQQKEGAFVGSEDCLTLNIWTPDKSAHLPMVIYIHGGGFSEGSGSEALYDGAYLADTYDVVVVTLNYRLGAAGFLAMPELSAESEDNVSGNYGLHDILEALRWVSINAEHFGADSDRTFVMGQSAGGVAVCMLLTSPLAQGLMSAAGVLGAPCGLAMQLDVGTAKIPSASSIGTQFADQLGCANAMNVVQCLRAVDIELLVATEAQMPRIEPFGLGVPPTLPNVDGVDFPSSPIAGVSSGLIDVPLLIGSNRDEVSVFLALALIANDGVYRIALASLFDSQAQAVYDLYPTAAFANAKEAYIQLIGDINVSCPAEAMAHAASGGQSAYLYEFSDVWPSGLSSLFGAFHGIELSYFFNAFDVFGIDPTAQDVSLAGELQQDWLGMVDGSPANVWWSGYTRAAPAYLRYGDTAEVVFADYRQGRCTGLRGLGIIE